MSPITNLNATAHMKVLSLYGIRVIEVCTGVCVSMSNSIQSACIVFISDVRADN